MHTTCENCSRPYTELATLTMEGHAADLCVTCQHILAQNKERFLQLVRSKSMAESNVEMKRKHRMLSTLLVAGVAGVTFIMGVGAAESIGIFTESQSIGQTEYLSFALLKQL
ncbi:hypothetical protein [Lysinibacillus odysseyi]|uniref:Uncharacterized protein n=1 Tax=Lysinibacillus odysseyi 34hs-1 = NBRC 100172 TaxID=1220589 RepID=A0A0A3IHE0_9BACI|nr:hypothetical protein [Lysinibacillus odysseyi]KGR82875.1 hypothetical protein CD32_18745 [Lysinibacillus odysseyi 34hs-1 = NBRC 100172]